MTQVNVNGPGTVDPGAPGPWYGGRTSILGALVAIALIVLLLIWLL